MSAKKIIGIGILVGVLILSITWTAEGQDTSPADDAESLEVGNIPQLPQPIEDPTELSEPPNLDILFAGNRLTYEQLELTITDNAMPELYRRLSDTAYWKVSPKIVKSIAFHGPSDESSESIINYIVSDEHPESMEYGYLSRFITNKINAVQDLGFTKGERAENFLKYIVYEGGAEELAPKWIATHPRLEDLEREEILVAVLKARAAMGMAILGETESRNRVDAMYQDLNSELRARVIRRLEPDESQVGAGPGREKEILINGLVEALALSDWMAEEGVQSYWKDIIDRPDEGSKKFWDYKERYRFYHWEYSFTPEESP